MKPTVHERGLALVCALTLMVAAMMIGVAVTRGAFVLLASARNERDRDVAQAAAEAALRDAEHDIAGAPGVPPERTAHFGPAGDQALVDGCGHGANDRGLCRARAPPAWQTLDLADAGNPALVPYGRFTGAVLAVGRGAPARLPAYVIERIAPAGATTQMGRFYRVTAIGFGTRTSTRIVLQSLVRLPLPVHGAGEDHGHGNDGNEGHDDDNGDTHEGGNGDRPQERRLPAGRIGWREIANWDELHAHAGP